jgi:hypothetical protein
LPDRIIATEGRKKNRPTPRPKAELAGEGSRGGRGGFAVGTSVCVRCVCACVCASAWRRRWGGAWGKNPWGTRMPRGACGEMLGTQSASSEADIKKTVFQSGAWAVDESPKCCEGGRSPHREKDLSGAEMVGQGEARPGRARRLTVDTTSSEGAAVCGFRGVRIAIRRVCR